MKTKFRCSVLFSAILALTGIQSCHKDTPAPTYNLNNNCFSRYSFVKTLSMIEATVINDASYPSVHTLHLSAPVQVGSRQVTDLNICSLPAALDKVSQRLLLSGALLDYNLETANGPLIIGQPFVLTDVKPE